MNPANLPGWKELSPVDLAALASSYYKTVHGERLRDVHHGFWESVVWCDRVLVCRQDSTETFRWLVYGDVPFVDFSVDEISTPAEAIGLYGWFVEAWMHYRGPESESDFPDYREIGTWVPLKRNMETVSWLGPRSSYINWSLLPEIGAEIHHPEIRERIMRKGIRLPPSSLG